MDTALLLILWRRPSETKKLIKAIKKIKPNNLYIACDGPIKKDFQCSQNVKEVKRLIETEINWDCSIKKRYSLENKGCKIGCTDAISWFFSHEEEGIILEDDCIPNNEFFIFCSELLEKYRFDNRIWQISGNGYQQGIIRGEASYFFSKYPQMWGWATWRRCWEKYDKDMKDWENNDIKKNLKKSFDSIKIWLYWKIIWDDIFYHGSPDTWDYQWVFTCMLNSGLIILPNKDLVKNIGFGPLASHNKNSKNSTLFKDYQNNIFPIKHPKYIYRFIEADLYLENTIQVKSPVRFYLKLILRFLKRKGARFFHY